LSSTSTLVGLGCGLASVPTGGGLSRSAVTSARWARAGRCPSLLRRRFPRPPRPRTWVEDSSCCWRSSWCWRPLVEKFVVRWDSPQWHQLWGHS
jgi:hypothetical protein